MKDIAQYIHDHAEETLSLSHLSDKFALSPAHLQKSFKRVFGLSPKEYQNGIRLARLKKALKDGDDISGAIYEAGYGAVSRIYEQIDGRIGMTPSAYRAGGMGEDIAYAIRDTTLGSMIMAATDRGVCYVHFGKDPESLIQSLSQEFPKGHIMPSPANHAPELDSWIEALNHHLSGNIPRPNIPLHLNGTAFQMRVWHFLMSVPEGDIKHYRDVANGIGAPKAIRAAASACGANKIAVLIPCHRVLRSDGGLGGYRWGLERKKELLRNEKAK